MKDCYKHMIKHLSQNGFEFTCTNTALKELKSTCHGNANDPTEPFSLGNYTNWAARLHTSFDWTCSRKDLKAARDSWLNVQTIPAVNKVEFVNASINNGFFTAVIGITLNTGQYREIPVSSPTPVSEW